MIRIKKQLRAPIVQKLLELGIDPSSILKIFIHYEAGSLLETLDYFENTAHQIPENCFFNKLNSLQRWDGRKYDDSSLFKKWKRGTVTTINNGG